MKNIILVSFLFFAGCVLTEPTYLPLQKSVITQIAEAHGTTLDKVLEIKPALIMDLSEKLGTEVLDVEILDGEYVAKLPPAVEEAGKKILQPIVQNPDRPDKWIGGILGGLAILGMGLLGWRGERKRKQAGTGA